MLYAIRFLDDPEQMLIREQQIQAHLAWLDQNKDVILVGGSLRPAPGENPVGGLWLVEAPNREAVEALLMKDPFWLHGLRSGFEIFLWTKAFPDRKVLV